MKAFISYSTLDRVAGGETKDVLDDLHIVSFLAHNDLRVSEEWKARILQELAECDIFIALLSKHFKKSDWCSQEIGAIVQRPSVLIVPLSLDATQPYGFISHLQGRTVAPTGVLGILSEVIGRKWPAIIIEALIDPLPNAASYDYAQKLVAPLVPYFPRLTKLQAKRFAGYAIENSQIWGARLCRDRYLPEFLELNRQNLPVRLYKTLKYQVEQQQWYASRIN